MLVGWVGRGEVNILLGEWVGVWGNGNNYLGKCNKGRGCLLGG